MKLFVVILLLAMVAPVLAVPTVSPVTLIGPDNATFSMTGATDPAWFSWGMATDKLYLKTPNGTPSGGALSKVVRGWPLMSARTYYVRACDTTGCSVATVSFTSGTVTPAPTLVGMSTAYENMSDSGFDIGFVAVDIVSPYLWLFPSDTQSTGVMLIAGLLLFGIYLGMTIRQRSTVISAMVGIITMSLFVSANFGLGLGLPPEWVALGQGILYASIAGLVVSIFKR